MTQYYNNTEWNKMIKGEVYNALDPMLIQKLAETRSALWEFNNLHPDKIDHGKKILRSLLGRIGNKFHINQPFRCDYGCNVFIGENFFANFNLTILDEAHVTIGDNVFIGPNVNIFTACHPLDAESRNTGVEWAEPITIGDNVWIGGGATILPGVSIGNNSVVGAGAVVTHNIPENVVVGGNPAKVIKHIE